MKIIERKGLLLSRQKIAERLKEKSITRMQLSDAIGIDKATFTRKMLDGEFTESEIYTMVLILGDIFIFN